MSGKPMHAYKNRETPAVPCATCGEPSDSWFSDGSPKWLNHSHAKPDPVAPTPPKPRTPDHDGWDDI